MDHYFSKSRIIWSLYICTIFNDTFIQVTDLSGRETYTRLAGWMKVKADRDESSLFAAVIAV